MATLSLKGRNGRTVTVDTRLFINNTFTSSIEGCTLDVENPTTGQRLATVSAAQLADVQSAVSAAKSAFHKSWKNSAPTLRGRLLTRLAELIERDAEDLATLEALDAGILFSESKDLMITQSIETLRYFSGWADKITGQLLHTSLGIAYTQREPLGVCAAIVPWNSPLMISIWKLAPALAAGNTLIIKTPEAAPLYGQKLASLIVEAGFPPGVVNIICGEGRIAGQALAEHCDVKKISFTGSTTVGRQVMQAAAKSNLKKVSLELGGKGPSIVFADAELDDAVFWTTLGITSNNGQVCVSGSRIYVHEDIYEEFLRQFSEKCVDSIYGNPLEDSTTKGPLINKTQYTKVLDYIERAKHDGLRLLHGGSRLGATGYFIANTAFAEVPDDADIMQQEIFGPVAAIQKFASEEEVIRKANNTSYGLSAAIFTTDVDCAHRVAGELEAGQVMVNCWGALDANVPFGGIKESGFGRELGEAALDDWMSIKSVKFRISKARAQL